MVNRHKNNLILKKTNKIKISNKKIFDYSIDTDKETLNQFKNCYSQDFVESAALMPDAHRGYVAPIGAVLSTKDYVVPSWVGYDIGCGMTAVKINEKKFHEFVIKNKERIYLELKKVVPMGLGETNNINHITKEGIKKYEELISDFEKKEHDKQVLNFIKSNKSKSYIGSLGKGNHFISLNKDEKDYIWIVVHSGSRGVGHWIAKFYMKKGLEENLKKKSNISDNLKFEKKSKKELKNKFEETYPLKVESQIGKEYLNALDFSLNFALLNRMEIIRKIIYTLENILNKKIKWDLWANKNHNHTIKEGNFWIHRKGATPAKKGEKGIIPSNMRDGSFLVKGKGNKSFLESSSHGAGRRLSRSEARKTLSIKKLKKSMEEEKIISGFNKFVLEESPEAYKDINKVLEAQKKSVKIIRHLKPIINWQE